MLEEWKKILSFQYILIENIFHILYIDSVFTLPKLLQIVHTSLPTHQYVFFSILKQKQKIKQEILKELLKKELKANK